MPVFRKIFIFLMWSCLLFSKGLYAESLSADQVLSLVKAGEILSLEEIIDQIPVISESRLLDIELEQEGSGKLIYEFELLKSNNEVVELAVDAVNGELLHEEFEE